MMKLGGFVQDFFGCSNMLFWRFQHVVEDGKPESETWFVDSGSGITRR
jgi:hypothetical protein